MGNLEKTALLFQMLCDRYDGADALGKKAGQKMFYFFERFGVDLKLRYGIHFYGPYSSKLDDMMYQLDCQGYINIDISGHTHTITGGNQKITEELLTPEEKDVVECVLQTFEHKTPMELEALSTMDYVANSLLHKGVTDEEIIAKFKQIKNTKFDQNTIDNCLRELKEMKLIAS